VRKFFVGILAAVMGTIGFGSVAFANSGNDSGYNPPPAVSGVCDAGHGAFGAFSHDTGSWIPADAIEDGGLGASTGPANSDLGMACAPGLQ